MIDTIQTIKQAAEKRKILRIVYREKDGTNDGGREVEPYSFSHDDGDQALFAWDIDKNGIRRFALDRIIQAEITDSNFNPRYPIEINWI